MSGNQKQAPAGAPQQQRFAQGADGYHVTTPPTGYVPQQTSNQQTNQGPNIRGMASTGPPNQSSTPPQNDLKQMQQQSGQLPMFVQQQVRTGQPSGFFRAPTPNQGGPRISNHHRQTMATNAAATTPIYSQHMQIYPTPMAQPMTSYPMAMQYNPPRPQANYYGPPFPVMHGQFLHGTFPTQQAQAQQFYYPNAATLTMANRQGPPPPVATAPQGSSQATQQPMQMQPTMPLPTKRKNRSNAIPIINPLSGKEIFDEEESQPPSGESSARETPQPPATTAMQQLISADFAARVAIVASEDKESIEPELPVPPVQAVTYGAPITMQPPPPPVQLPHNAVHMVATCPPKENDLHKVIESSVVQNSKLQASVKEFIPEITKHVPKENTTPVVSANTEGVEVTLPSKQSRDRESPSKMRRNQPHQHQQPHQQQQQQHHQQQHQISHQQYHQQLHQQHQQQQSHPQQLQHSQQQPHHQQQQTPQQPPQQLPQQQQQPQQPQQQQPPPQQQLPPPQQHREPSKEIIIPDCPPPAIVKEVPIAVVSSVNQVAANEPELKDLKPVVVNAKVKSMSSEFTKATVVVDHRPTPPPPPQQQQQLPPAQTNSVAAHADDTILNAKSKGGAQKAKENSASAVVQPAAPKAAMPVPGSQPAKPSSKANKLRELNMKGANKEGTDMDVFNATSIPTTTAPIENCNSEPIVAVKEECIEPDPEPQIQRAPTPPPQQPQPTVPPQPILPPVQQQPTPPAQVVAAGPPQKLPEVKSATLPKQKIDITSIVKEIPRPLKPQPPPATQEQMQSHQSATDSNNETDPAAGDKLVQVKNDTNNIKTNSSENSDTQVIDKTVIRYKKDQWSPMNTEGKKSYDRDFLINLQLNPKCKNKPDNLPDLDIILKDSNRSRVDPRSFNTNRQSELLMPSFHKSLSQRGPLPKRNSQQGNKGGNKGGKPNTIHVTLSLREDVKLRETENAWRPARQISTKTMSKAEWDTAVLYKKVRGVLNKLTPEKFDKLVSQVRDLQIDNEERLQGVIDLVFEKAVDEPNFSVAYALMCKELSAMQVPISNKSKDDPDEVNFRKLLITRCQLEFEKNTQLENERILKQKEIKACTDPEKKKDLQMQLEDAERRMRVKSVGNIRFIGELFKQSMLTTRIMMRCVNILLDNKDEDSLECLCKLLTTIGKDLEVKSQNLQPFFNQMQEFVDRKRGVISSRVRFMLQDVIDLRNSKWVPRRQDLNPKKMNQIVKEAQTEQVNIILMNMAMTPRKDDRMGSGQGGSGANSDHKRRSNQTDESGWSLPNSRNRATPYTVESSKLMNKPPPMEEMTLGSKYLFGQWGRGSNIKTQAHVPITNTANMYAALENIDGDKTRLNYESRMNKDTYVSKGHSMDRTGYKQTYEDGRNSRSGSQHRNQPQQSQKPASVAPPAAAATVVVPVAEPPKPQLNPEQLRLKMKNILDEYLNDCSSLEECAQDIRASIDPSQLVQLIDVGCNGMLERSQSTRHKTGKLYSYLVNSGLLPLNELCTALTGVLSQAEDLIIDIPMLWCYLSEMLLPLVLDDLIPFDILCTCSEVLIAQGYAHKLFAQLIIQLVAYKGPNYISDLWYVSGIQFCDFMPAKNVDAYIKEHKFDFLLGGEETPDIIPSTLTWDQVHTKLLELLRSETSSDTIIDWISANIGSRIVENQFVRQLVTAIIEVSVVNSNGNMKMRYDILKKHYVLLQRYIDNQENLELQSVFAVHALLQKWEHPPGVLLDVFGILYEDGILSNDCFLEWEKNKDPMEQEGKGVALKSLQSLFTVLRENENEYETLSSGSDEA